MMNDELKLIRQRMTTSDAGDSIPTERARTVFCERKSIGLKRKLEAEEAGLKLEHKFVIQDEMDYRGEDICEFHGRRYNIVNVFVNDDHTVELTAARY